MTPPIPPESPSPLIEALMRALGTMQQKVPAAAPRDATALRSPVPPDYDPTPIPEAQAQMAANGITDRQRSLGHSRLGDAAYLNVTPWGYDGHSLELLKTIKDAIGSKPLDTSQRPPNRSVPLATSRLLGGTPPNRDDAWRVYLGLPQKDSTLGVSDYQPTRATAQQPYFKLNKFEESYNFNNPSRLRAAVEMAKAAQAQGKQSVPAYDPTGVMGHYQLSHGLDDAGRPYLAYYDKWDLDTPGGHKAGHAYDLYDRIYYDPKTYKVIPQPAPTPTRPKQSAFMQALLSATPKDSLRQLETTHLAPQQEAAFQQWARTQGITDANDPAANYDYRGYWLQNGDKPVRFGVDHFPDTFKQHGHPTFSVESKYSTNPTDGGRWNGETYTPPAKEPSLMELLRSLSARGKP
jgi:hypothetical protein